MPKKRPRNRNRPPSSGVKTPGRPLAICIYGPSGVGKTEFAASFEDVEFIHDPQEDGILDLVEYGRCKEPYGVTEVDTFQSLLEACDRACASGSKAVALDSLTGFEKLCFVHHCHLYFDDDWSKEGFYSYYSGPKNACKTDWPNFLDHLDNIRASGKHVILIGHSAVRPFKNPDGTDFDQYHPFLEKETWAVTHRWAQTVLFYNFIMEIDEKKKKARTEHRALFTEHGASYIAKNRMGLPPVIDAGEDGKECWSNFMSAIEACRK